MSVTDDLLPGGELAAEISTTVVRVLARYAGRGPTKARTYRGPDLVVVALEEALTQGEQTLVDHGRPELARDARHALQGAARDDLVAEIERLMCRKVRAYLSAAEVQPDVAVLTFLLEPEA